MLPAVLGLVHGLAGRLHVHGRVDSCDALAGHEGAGKPRVDPAGVLRD